MNSIPSASYQLIRTAVSHTVRTAMVRDDSVGWVVSGLKRLATPMGETRFAKGQAFLMSRSTQWDMINESAPGGHYEARMLSFAPSLLEKFHSLFAQFAATPPLQGCVATEADEAFLASFSHATAALQAPDLSKALREHRSLDVLLLLAERGLVFAPVSELSWSERVHRLVGQRPHADWSVAEVAQTFHLSVSTLQRRLAEEGASLSRCVREVRLEVGMALLQGTELQVSEIAARCGYESHSRFTAAFKQRFGYAPSYLRP